MWAATLFVLIALMLPATRTDALAGAPFLTLPADPFGLLQYGVRVSAFVQGTTALHSLVSVSSPFVSTYELQAVLDFIEEAGAGQYQLQQDGLAACLQYALSMSSSAKALLLACFFFRDSTASATVGP